MHSKIVICFLLFIVSNRMVSLCLRQPNNQTEREMVLPEMFRRSEKEVKNANYLLYLIVIAHSKINPHAIIGFLNKLIAAPLTR